MNFCCLICGSIVKEVTTTSAIGVGDGDCIFEKNNGGSNSGWIGSTTDVSDVSMLLQVESARRQTEEATVASSTSYFTTQQYKQLQQRQEQQQQVALLTLSQQSTDGSNFDGGDNQQNNEKYVSTSSSGSTPGVICSTCASAFVMADDSVSDNAVGDNGSKRPVNRNSTTNHDGVSSIAYCPYKNSSQVSEDGTVLSSTASSFKTSVDDQHKQQQEEQEKYNEELSFLRCLMCSTYISNSLIVPINNNNNNTSKTQYRISNNDKSSKPIKTKRLCRQCIQTALEAVIDDNELDHNVNNCSILNDENSRKRPSHHAHQTIQESSISCESQENEKYNEELSFLRCLMCSTYVSNSSFAPINNNNNNNNNMTTSKTQDINNSDKCNTQVKMNRLCRQCIQIALDAVVDDNELECNISNDIILNDQNSKKRPYHHTQQTIQESNSCYDSPLITTKRRLEFDNDPGNQLNIRRTINRFVVDVDNDDVDDTDDDQTYDDNANDDDDNQHNNHNLDWRTLNKVDDDPYHDCSDNNIRTFECIEIDIDNDDDDDSVEEMQVLTPTALVQIKVKEAIEGGKMIEIPSSPET